LAEVQEESDHRLFLATNKPLDCLVRDGKFREDLLARVQLFHLPIPPLRERRDVIRALVMSMLGAVNYRHRGTKKERDPLNDADRCYATAVPGKGPWFNWVMRLEEEDLRWCEQHDWPHNIRELEHRLELYVFHQGQKRLKDVAAARISAATPTPVAASNAAHPELIGQAVAVYLDAVLLGQEPPPKQPGAFLDLFRDLVKESFCVFTERRRLKTKEMQQLFPDAKDAGTTISNWRNLTKLK
jgi:transcriptional regulator with AAA-type ATPase domain